MYELHMENSVSSPTSPLKNQIYRAGAGAGKTRKLVEKVLEVEDFFLRAENRHARLVVTTFTKKATQELRQRLLERSLEEKNSTWVEFVQSESRLHVSTIHGVFSKFLRQFGSELEIGPENKILSEYEAYLRGKKVFRDLLHKNQDFLRISSELLEVYELRDLLGALFESESAFFLGRQQRCSQNELMHIRGETLAEFDRRHSHLKHVLDQALNDLPQSWRAFRTALNLISNSEDTQNLLLWRDHHTLPRSSDKISSAVIDARDEFMEQFQVATQFGMRMEFIENHEKLSRQFETVATTWTKALFDEKKKTGSFSYLDLEILSLKLCQESPQSARAFAKEWDYWLLDEYQDTSPIQVEILQHLIGDRCSFVVGDPQQSIYLFRGARSEVFRAKEMDFRERQGEVLELMDNYRSDKPVVEFFNDVFHRINPNEFKAMQSATKNLPGQWPPVEITTPAPTNEFSDEFNLVLHKVQDLLRAGEPPQSIAVLGRNHKHLKELAKRAHKLTIPYQLVDSGKFSQKQEVIDASALLRFLLNPNDNLSLTLLLRSPFFHVADTELSILKDVRENLFSFVRNQTWPAVEKLQNLISMSHTHGVLAAWKHGLNTCGFFNYYRQMDSSGGAEGNLWYLVAKLEGQIRKENFSILDWLDQLFEEKISESESPNLSGKVQMMTVHAAKGLDFKHVFVPFLSKSLPTPKTRFYLRDDNDKWTLAVPDEETGGQKSSLLGKKILAEQKSREAAEQIRVLYVALTRAVQSLHLSWDQPKKGTLAQILIDVGFTASPVEVPALTPYRIFDKTSEGLAAPFASTQISHQQTQSITSILKARFQAEKLDFDYKPALKGIEVHRQLEDYKYSRKAPMPEFFKKWRNGFLLQAISKGEVEWGFTFIDPNTRERISGQIDLWYKDEQNHCSIIDYKTGSDFYKEKAFLQLEMYARALQAMGKIDSSTNVNLIAVFTESQLAFEKVWQANNNHTSRDDVHSPGSMI